MSDLQQIILVALREIEVGTTWGLACEVSRLGYTLGSDRIRRELEALRSSGYVAETDGGWGLTLAGERLPLSVSCF